MPTATTVKKNALLLLLSFAAEEEEDEVKGERALLQQRQGARDAMRASS